MRKMIFALAAGLGLFGGTSVWAQVLDFNAPGGTGSVTYAGGANPLVVTGVGVTSVIGLGTPLHPGVSLTYTPAGTEAFTTGNYVAAGSGGNIWNFGGGGPITISGTIPAQGTFPGDVAGTQLTGTIQSARVDTTGPATSVVLSVFINTIDAALSTYYGIPTGARWAGNLTLHFSPDGITNTTPATGTAFSSTVVGSGDTTTSPVPEPSSLAIAGIGALGLIGYGLRRRKALGA